MSSKEDYFLCVKINQISRKPVNKGKSRIYTGKEGDFTTNLLLFKSLAIMNMYLYVIIIWDKMWAVFGLLFVPKMGKKCPAD